MPAVIGLGEAMILLLAQQPGPLREVTSFTRHVAGAESNVAVGVSRLGVEAGFISRVGAAEIAHAAGVTVVFDPNVRLKLWTAEDARPILRDLVAHADIVVPGADEAELLTGESDPLRATRALAELGPRLVVTKHGARGAIA